MLGRLSVRWKIALLPALAAVGLSASTVLIALLGVRSDRSLRAVEQSAAPALDLARSLTTVLADMKQDLRLAVVLSASGGMAAADGRLEEARALLEVATQTATLPAPAIASLREAVTAYHSLARKDAELMLAGQADPIRTSQVVARYDALMADLEELTTTQRRQIEASLGQVRAEQRVSVIGVLAISLACLALLVGVSWWLIRRITGPLDQVCVGLERVIRRGELSFDVDASGGDEVGRLARLSQELVSSLREIADTARGVAAGRIDRRIAARSGDDQLAHALGEMTDYLQEMAAAATRVSRGELGVVVRARGPEDAFGRALESMLHSLRALALDLRDGSGRVKDAAQHVTSSAVSIDAGARRQASTSREITQRMHAIGKQTETVARVSREHRATADTIEDFVRGLQTGMGEVIEGADQLARLGGTIARRAGELLDHTGRVAGGTEAVSQANETLVASLLELKSGAEETRSLAREQGRRLIEVAEAIRLRCAQVGDVTRMIQEVTRHTNLVALNAAIVASQAGGTGRSFGVVAAEISTLAGRIRGAATDIESALDSIQSEADDATSLTRTIVDQMSASSERVFGLVSTSYERMEVQRMQAADLTEQARRITAMVRDVQNATAQQERATVSILRAARTAGEQSARVLHAARGLREHTAQLGVAAKEQLELTDQVAAGAHASTTVAQEHQRETRAMLEAARGLDEQAAALLEAASSMRLTG